MVNIYLCSGQVNRAAEQKHADCLMLFRYQIKMSLSVGSGNNSYESSVVDESKKHNHSEIEKRRRDKMNHYITELSWLIPMCNAISRKLDKLTVLRMAVQHMKTIKGNMNAFVGGSQIKPTFLSDQALLELILQVIQSKAITRTFPTDRCSRFQMAFYLWSAVIADESCSSRNLCLKY